jgi:hypothetical protein
MLRDGMMGAFALIGTTRIAWCVDAYVGVGSRVSEMWHWSLAPKWKRVIGEKETNSRGIGV